MKKLLKFLNKKLGLYTKSQYNELKDKYTEISEWYTELDRKDNSNKFFISKLKEQIREMPFGMDTLIIGYTKDQLNAFVYKAIQHAWTKEELHELLDRWLIRINKAKESIDRKDKKRDIDRITPSHFPGH